MLISVCPSCNKLFADIEILYENDVKEIQNNRDMTNDEKLDAIANLLDKYHVKRYCCRMRVMSYLSEIDLLI